MSSLRESFGRIGQYPTDTCQKWRKPAAVVFRSGRVVYKEQFLWAFLLPFQRLVISNYKDYDLTGV
jgi:hypothetical protein